MKTFLISLFVFIFISGNMLNAQPLPHIKANSAINQSVQVDAKTGKIILPVTPQTTPTMLQRSFEESYAGLTFYDLQTNASMSRRIVAWEDGTVSLVFTTCTNNATDRGTGYNYYNGTSFLYGTSEPTPRIESIRTGWPTIGKLGVSSEIIVSHNGTTGLVVLTRPQKGTGDWNQQILVGPTVSNGTQNSTALLWPSIATVADTIFLIACTESNEGYLFNGINTCLVYYRGVYNRTNNSVSWSSPVVVGNLTSNDIKKFTGDSYSIAARDNKVTILYNDSHFDIFYWESNDYGHTFDAPHTVFATTIQKPYAENTTFVTDTPYVSDGSGTIAIDAQGTVHIAFGVTRVLNADITDGVSSWYPLVQGLIYWNSTMSPFTAEEQRNALSPYDLQENGGIVFFQPDLTGEDTIYSLSYNPDNGENAFTHHIVSYSVSPVSMPQLVCHNGVVYLIFCSELEYPFYDSGTPAKHFRGIFGAKSIDGGLTWDTENGLSWMSYGNELTYVDWTLFQELNNSGGNPASAIWMNSENVFPAVATDVVNGDLNILWQNGMVAGSFIRENTNSSIASYESYMWWKNFYADSVGVKYNTRKVWQGVYEGVEVNTVFSNVNVFPNPAENNVWIAIESTQSQDATLTISNLMGQMVYSQNIAINTGQNRIQLNVRDLVSGMYLVNIHSHQGMISKKLIVK
jgi:hypothetical protein